MRFHIVGHPELKSIVKNKNNGEVNVCHCLTISRFHVIQPIDEQDVILVLRSKTPQVSVAYTEKNQKDIIYSDEVINI